MLYLYQRLYFSSCECAYIKEHVHQVVTSRVHHGRHLYPIHMFWGTVLVQDSSNIHIHLFTSVIKYTYTYFRNLIISFLKFSPIFSMSINPRLTYVCVCAMSKINPTWRREIYDFLHFLRVYINIYTSGCIKVKSSSDKTVLQTVDDGTTKVVLHLKLSDPSLSNIYLVTRHCLTRCDYNY